MNAPNDMRQVQIFVLERAQWHGEPLYQAIVRLLQRNGAAGATVLRGVAGFGAHHHLHRATFVDVGADLPLVILWVDRAERVARLLPQIEVMVESGAIVTFPVTAIQRQPPFQEHLPHDLRVGHVMTQAVVSVTPDTPISTIVERFLHESLRTIPVVDDEQHIVGVISDGDLLRRAKLALPLSIREALTPRELGAPPEIALRARDVMTEKVVTVPVNLPLVKAIDRLARLGFKRLPVVNGDARVVGILSRADVLQAIAHAAPPVMRPSEPSPHPRHVADVMQRDVPTVRHDTPLTDVVEALASVEQRRVVVVDAAQQVLGIITDGDVIRRATAEERPGIVRRMLERLRGGSTGHARALVISGRTAAAVMTTPVVTIAADALPEQALRLMLDHGVKRLPVLAADGQFVGLIGRAGVLRALSAEP